MTDPRAPAERLLAAVVAAFGSSAPERRYIAPSPLAAWDDEHLAVSLAQVLPGTSDATGRAGGLPSRHAGDMQIPRGAYEARILRCFPTLDSQGNPPPAAAIHAAAVGLLDDVALLLAGAYQFLADSPNGVATVGQVDPLGPEGALAGYRVVVTYSPIQ